ncbi:MAG: septum formation protein Maf [Opitutales bacterium]|nr:septum formation protein Maf [Opitutales bacterium]
MKKKNHRDTSQPLILASGSPRRQQILARLGKTFQVVSPEVEEARSAETPATLTLLNARKKARAVWEENRGAVVLAADTVVAEGGRILNKPESREEALTMLLSLSGRTHEVFTGVVVNFAGTDGALVCREEVARSEVIFKSFEEAVARAYHDLVNPLDKAGAYGIQEGREQVLAGWRGSFFNIMGLPLRETLCLLDEAGA